MFYPMSKNIVILAAGVSSRMRKSLLESNKIIDPKTIEYLNKSLIPIGKSSRPFLDYLLSNIIEAGYENVYLVVGEHSEAFKKFYGTKKAQNDYRNLNISYATQYIAKDRIKPWGTADAVLQALEQYPELLNESITICNADNLYSMQALKYLRESEFENAVIAYERDGLDFPIERISLFALMELDVKKNLKSIIEKPMPSDVQRIKETTDTLLVSMNLWKLKGKALFHYLKSCPINKQRDEKELPTAILNMINEASIMVKAITFRQHVPDLTSESDIAALQKYI